MFTLLFYDLDGSLFSLLVYDFLNRFGHLIWAFGANQQLRIIVLATHGLLAAFIFNPNQQATFVNLA